MIHKQMQIENKSLSDNCYCLSESLEPFKSNISDFSTNVFAKLLNKSTNFLLFKYNIT